MDSQGENGPKVISDDEFYIDYMLRTEFNDLRTVPRDKLVKLNVFMIINRRMSIILQKLTENVLYLIFHQSEGL